jgi:16S rRNA (guanine527-N7)-methyltransferase
MSDGVGPAFERPVPPAVLDVLSAAQAQGFIGPGALSPHIAHAFGFLAVLDRARGRVLSFDDRVLDLGAGGGIPGLVLAAECPGVPFSLLEGSVRRAEFLEEATGRCGLRPQVAVVAMRAELAGRDEALRGRCTVVFSRSFGGPGDTAECASPFLCVDGHLVVSEPPAARQGVGWPPDGLALLGLEPVPIEGNETRYAVFRQARACPDRYPRRVGVPRKRPLF